jgi:hypothetical protein
VLDRLSHIPELNVGRRQADPRIGFPGALLDGLFKFLDCRFIEVKLQIRRAQVRVPLRAAFFRIRKIPECLQRRQIILGIKLRAPAREAIVRFSRPVEEGQENGDDQEQKESGAAKQNIAFHQEHIISPAR